MVHKSVEVNFFLCFEANRPSIQGSNSLFDLFVFFSSWFLLVCVFELNFISWSSTTRAAAVGEGHCVGQGEEEDTQRRVSLSLLTLYRTMNSQYWLVSLPLEGGSADRTWSILQDKTCHDNDLSVSYKVCAFPLALDAVECTGCPFRVS